MEFEQIVCVSTHKNNPKQTQEGQRTPPISHHFHTHGEELGGADSSLETLSPS